MKRFLFILVLIISVLASGCTSVQKKKDKAVAAAIYNAQKAISVGKISAAKRIIDEATKLVAPPKNVIKFEEAKDKEGKGVVILPSEFSSKSIIVEDSPEYQKLLGENKNLATQIDKEKIGFEKYKQEVDNTVRAIYEEANKEKRKSGLAWLIGGLGIFGFGGAILIMFLFPPAIPIITNLIKFFVSWVGSIFENLCKAFKKNG